eukprot:2226543-Pyramimonas_sp.AAC.1
MSRPLGTSSFAARAAEEEVRGRRMGVGAMLSQPVSGPAAEKWAKRLALNFERQTTWGILHPGVGLDLVGDSMLVAQG